MSLLRIVAAGALAVLASLPSGASASCLSDFRDATTPPPQPTYSLKRYVESSGLNVAVHGDNVVTDVGAAENDVLYVVTRTPGATVAFVNCVA